MRLARILGYGLLGIAGLAAILVFVALWRFYVPSASAVRLSQIHAQRPQVPEAENAYIYIWGLPAPPAADALEMARKRIAWLQQKALNPDDYSPDPLGETAELASLRTPGMKALVKACGSSPGLECVTAFDEWPADLALNSLENASLQRYRVLLAHRHWFESVPFLGEGPLPPFGEAFEAQRVQMLELRRAAAAGDAAQVRDTLQADLAFWREMMNSSDMLIPKLIACSAIRYHFFYGNLVLRRLPPEKQAEAIPPLWRQSLSTGELSMFRAMAGEFEYARGRVAVVARHGRRLRGVRRGIRRGPGRRVVGKDRSPRQALAARAQSTWPTPISDWRKRLPCLSISIRSRRPVTRNASPTSR